jgi:hypothetical protein
MIPTLTEQQYLSTLKESSGQAIGSFVGLLDFSLNETYTGNETIGELLHNEGITSIFIEEGIASLPINKLKSISARLMTNAGSKEGLENTKKMFGSMAARIKPADLAQQAQKMGASKGIDEAQIKSGFEKVMRFFGVLNLASSLLNPLGRVVVLVALIKAGNFKDFIKGIEESVTEIGKSVERTDSKFEETMKIQAEVMRLLFFCMIPPWIQAIVFAPIMFVMAIYGYVIFVIEFLKQF